jgi:DNA-binding response OmpR family regulator
VAIVSCEPARSSDHVRIMDLTGRIILVVEDEPIVSLEVTSRLEAEGAHVLAAGDLERALVHADHPDLSAAVLDFDLVGADTTPVCWKLIDRGIPFLFHTGRVYSAFQQWPAAPVLLKPGASAIVAAVEALLR